MRFGLLGLKKSLSEALKQGSPLSGTDVLYKIDFRENGVSVLDRVLRKLVEAEREKNGRKTQTTMIIVDSKSIQNADTAEGKGYDAGKKYPG